MPEQSVRLRSKTLLRELMRAANNGDGYSLRDMADRLPCGKSMIHALISDSEKHGKVTCTQSLAVRIAEVVGVPFAVLFEPSPSTHRGRPSTKKEPVAA